MTAETRGFILVWAALLALLAATMLATFLPIGELKAPLNLLIAVVKAGLVAWFFMHLRKATGLVRLFALGGLFWLGLLFSLTFADYATRHPVPRPVEAATGFPRD